MALEEVERTGAVGSAVSDASGARSWPRYWPLLLFSFLLMLGLVIYRPALLGPFISDDVGYLVSNPYTASLNLDNARAIADPRGQARLYTANYAPVHLFLTAIERQIFADSQFGYHLVNLVIHALVGTLLVIWLLQWGVWPKLALWGGLVFFVHPANVEAVAWASQLKTCGALMFALAALIAFPRMRAIAAILFALSLLTKASGLFALPAAAAFVWAERISGRARRNDTIWLGVWLGTALLYMIPQYDAYAHLGAVEVAAYEDPLTHLRTIAAVGARYLVMAVSGSGVSAFQDPPPAVSWLDPWWLAAVPIAAFIGVRASRMLWRGSLEGAFWLAAAGAFAPVSQVFPFLHPVADRYLYFILPGLLGASALWVQDLISRRPRFVCEAMAGIPVRALRTIVALASAVVVVTFAVHSASRAHLWRSEALLMLDAASHYPESVTAYILSARGAAQRGDAGAAVIALRSAYDLGLDRFMAVRDDPGLAPLRNDADFHALIGQMAKRWIERAHGRGYKAQPELRMLGLAHMVRKEFTEAVAAFEASLAAGGPLTDVVLGELAEARRAASAAPEQTSDSLPDA